MRISRIWLLNLSALLVLIIIIIAGRSSVIPPPEELKKPDLKPTKAIIPGGELETKRPPHQQLSPWQKRKSGISPEKEWTAISEQMEAYFEEKSDNPEEVKMGLKEMSVDMDRQIEQVRLEIERKPDSKSKQLLLQDLEKMKELLPVQEWDGQD